MSDSPIPQILVFFTLVLVLANLAISIYLIVMYKKQNTEHENDLIEMKQKIGAVARDYACPK
jgi:hypothetical protein